ncbi:autophagy-related protein 13-domain-containing protein [Spinellus fusiger]|nr:autophagy-related protein 13-domain-containing protein [Spinellus fusiger]
MHAHSPSTPIASSSSGTRNSKLEHIIQNFYTKTAQVIVQARIDVESSHKEKKNSHGRKINKWFNVVTEDIESLREELKHWRRLSVRYGEEEPPPMVLDLYLDTSEIRRGQVLVAVDDNLQRHRVDLGMHGSQEVHRILVETWVLTLNHPLPDTPVDLPNLYKRSIIFFRSLHSLVRLLPGHSLQQRLKDTSGAGLSLKYRLSSSLQHSSDEIALSQPIMSGDMQNQTQTYDFSDIVTPLGTLKLQLYYRKSCDFQIENHLSSLPSASSMDQERHKGATEPRAIRHSATETQLQGGAEIANRVPCHVLHWLLLL